MTTRIEWADALKGFLILMVVLGHSIQTVCDSYLHNYLWNLIYSFHMPAFMAVSGYLAYNVNRGGYDANGLMSGIYRRFRQLMIPFLIWSVIMYFVNHNVGHLYDYILYPNNSFWFLWALFFIICLFNVLRYISVKLNIKEEVLMIAAAVGLLGLQIVLKDVKLLGFEYVSYYYFYYILAYFLHKYQDLIPKNRWILIILAVIWLALGSFYKAKGVPYLVSWIQFIPDGLLNIAYRVVTAVIFILMMFGIAMKHSSFLSRRWLFELGKISLGIYVVHMVIKGWLVKGLLVVLPEISQWFLILITFLLLSSISFLIVKLLSTNKITSKWLLGKL